MTGILGAQTASDFGTVWAKSEITSNESAFSNIALQYDNTYTASGFITIGGVRQGYIVHFNEAGTILNSYIIPLPKTSSTNVGSPWGRIEKSYYLEDGTLIAIGRIENPTASSADKVPLYNTGGQLIYGSWFVKIASGSTNIEINRLDRGLFYSNMLYNGSDRNSVIVIGADVWLSNPGSSPGDIGLIKVFNSNGSIVYDNQSAATADRVQGNGLDGIVYKNGIYIINSNIGISEVNANTYKLIKQITPPTPSCLPPTSDYPSGTSTWPRKTLVTPLNSGKYLLSTLIAYNSIATNRYGWSFSTFSNTGVAIDCSVVVPVTTKVSGTNTYTQVLQFPGSTNEYLGTYTDIAGLKYMYKYSDFGTFPNILVGAQYPLNTALSLPSAIDGFFACGQDNITKTASIAKMSTCVNFITTSLPDPSVIKIFNETYSSSLNFSLPLNYQGNKGTVTYDLQAVVNSGTVNGISATDATGGILYTKTGEAVESTTIATEINDNWTLNTKYATIEYRFTLHDAYQTAGVDQSCGQTYIFRVVIAPQTDVVAMPTRVNDGTNNIVKTSFKNIGEGSFEDYKITIYDSTLGSTTKYTYTVSGLIAPNETSRLEIDLTGSPVANSSTLVVSFNDDGSGTQSQTEQSDTQFTYTVN